MSSKRRKEPAAVRTDLDAEDQGAAVADEIIAAISDSPEVSHLVTAVKELAVPNLLPLLRLQQRCLDIRAAELARIQVERQQVREEAVGAMVRLMAEHPQVRDGLAQPHYLDQIKDQST